MSDNRRRIIAPWRALLESHSLVVDILAREMKVATGLSIGWYEVLLHLSDAPGQRLRMHEIADSMLLSRSAVTRFVDRMERADLVERSVCESDRRGFELVMTEHGREQFVAAGRVHLKGIREHFSQHLTSAEAEVIERALGRVTAAARATQSVAKAAPTRS